MNALHIHGGHAAGLAQPRAARLGAAAWLALWRLVGHFGRQQSPPVRNAAAEANEVRELAWQVRRHDPRFADDLYAAADRHEWLYG